MPYKRIVTSIVRTSLVYERVANQRELYVSGHIIRVTNKVFLEIE